MRGKRFAAVGSVLVLAGGVAAAVMTAAAAAASSGGGGGDAVKVGLITKTDTNPFFVKMKEGAQRAAQGRAPSCSRSRARRTATTSRRWTRSRT